jgi:predicted DNA-binding transcriptional regulator AlpA
MQSKSQFRPVRRFLTRKQTAEKLTISTRTLKRMEHVLPPVQISDGRVAYFDDEVDAYARSRTRALNSR